MFEPIERYPELGRLQENWEVIRDEALPKLFAFSEMRDGRSDGADWKVLPLLAEAEDQGVFSESDIAIARGFVPRTCRMVDPIPSLRAYALSLVAPGGRIKPHCHNNPYVSASLCLSGGAGSSIIVDGNRLELYDGAMALFDYRRIHEVRNEGKTPRLALIVAVDRRECVCR